MALLDFVISGGGGFSIDRRGYSGMVALAKAEMMRIDVYHHVSWEDEAPPWARQIAHQAGIVLQRTENIMIDTSKLLESARRQSTENASLRALVASVKEQLTTTKADLAAAIAANDPVAMAAAQKDIDDTVALLDADDGETAAALAENVAPTDTAPSA